MRTRLPPLYLSFLFCEIAGCNRVSAVITSRRNVTSLKRMLETQRLHHATAASCFGLQCHPLVHWYGRSLMFAEHSQWNKAMRALALASLMVGCAAAQTLTSGVQATTVAASAPEGVAYDTSGNLYFSSRNDHAVRKIDIYGTVTTVAGTGQQGFAGDGGAATSALLDTPTGIAVDSTSRIAAITASVWFLPLGSSARLLARASRASLAMEQLQLRRNSISRTALAWTLPAMYTSPTRTTTAYARSPGR